MISNDKFASCSSDKTIKLFDLNTFKCIRTFNGHKDTVWDIEKFTSNKKLISCSSDALIKVWDLESGRCLKNIQDSYASLLEQNNSLKEQLGISQVYNVAYLKQIKLSNKEISTMSIQHLIKSKSTSRH